MVHHPSPRLVRAILFVTFRNSARIAHLIVRQISAGLSKSTIFNWASVEVTLPALTMEGVDPSPMLHITMQSELITKLAIEYPGPKSVVKPSQVRHYESLIKTWTQAFPGVYAFIEPDTSKDDKYPWIVFNRYYLYTMAYFMLLTPIRPYMAKEYTNAAPKEELDICANGIEYCLLNLRAAMKWAEHVSQHGGGFHFMITSVFDTTLLLCTIMLKDVENLIPKDKDIYKDLENGVSFLSRVRHSSPIAKIARDSAAKLVQSLPRGSPPSQPRKRLRSNDMLPTAISANEAGSYETGTGDKADQEANALDLSPGVWTTVKLTPPGGRQSEYMDCNYAPSPPDPQGIGWGAISSSEFGMPAIDSVPGEPIGEPNSSQPVGDDIPQDFGGDGALGADLEQLWQLYDFDDLSNWEINF